jgi:hypothetical protein
MVRRQLTVLGCMGQPVPAMGWPVQLTPAMGCTVQPPPAVGWAVGPPLAMVYSGLSHLLVTVYTVWPALTATAGGFVNSVGGFAGYFQGNVDVVGNLSKSGGSFKIDDPLDPANKYLYHSFVESPDMKNIYDGVATLDPSGEAIVVMPDWFGELNRDFRYQLTCIGGFAPVYIAEELANNQFKIGGGRAGMRISWQITGIRQDPWANAHRIPVEEEKEEKVKGFYLHPELYGAPNEKGIEWARHPEMMKKLQQDREQMKEKQARLTQSAALPRGSTK